MRSEKEMMELILSTAREDERIRYVVMNGSRANPEAKADIFQDYDIVYGVARLADFIEDPNWIDRFGNILVMQKPDTTRIYPGEVRKGAFAYLMQFTDGNRMDLTLVSPEKTDEYVGRDSQTIVLLDKDGILPKVGRPSDRDYWIKPPTEKEFSDSCNEFFWVSPYVAKGLWRGEMPYALEMLNVPVREMLVRMLEWHIGIQYDFKVSAGKAGKNFERYLEPELFAAYLATYPAAHRAAVWDSLMAMQRLFNRLAREIAQYFGYPYPEEDSRRVFLHLEHVRALPKDAEVLYTKEETRRLFGEME